jgi:hypothetical protein
MSERRVDIRGRDVTDLPGLWSDDDKRMSEQIEPGEGWRLLGPDEVVKDGDEPWHRFEKRWMLIPMDVPYTAKAYPAVRRRIPAKPEAIEINGHRVSLKSGFMRIGRLSSHYYFTARPAAIRQLADWLNRYADWREAQDAAK